MAPRVLPPLRHRLQRRRRRSLRIHGSEKRNLRIQRRREVSERALERLHSNSWPLSGRTCWKRLDQDLSRGKGHRLLALGFDGRHDWRRFEDFQDRRFPALGPRKQSQKP